MTMINKVQENIFEVVTVKGCVITVSFFDFGCVVYVPRSGYQFTVGKNFKSLTDAAASYKKADIRDALLLLADDLAA